MIEVRQTRGALIASVTRQTRTDAYLFSTPHAEVRIRGTKFRLSTDDRKTEVAVSEGKVAVTGRKDREITLVPAGQSCLVVEGIVNPPRVGGEVVVGGKPDETLDPRFGGVFFKTDAGLFRSDNGKSLWRARIGPRIEVVLSHGAENSFGTAQTNWLGVALTNSVQSPQVQGGTQYVCTGWTLTGQTGTGGASAGFGLTMTMTHTNDAILAWQWQTNYWCVFASNGLGGVSRTNSWLPRGGAVSVTAVPAYTNRFHHWSGTGTNFIVAGNASTPTVQVAAGAPFDLIANFISAYEAWRQAHFTAEQLANPEVSGDDADPDHDGMSNEQEYLAGTEPKNGRSCLVCSAAAPGEGGFVLQWQSASGKVYSVSVSTNLMSDLFTNRLATGILATPPTNTYEDAVSRGGCVFYRVACEKPDPFFPDISAAQALQLIAARGGDSDFVVLDVRTCVEYAARHIVGAINIDSSAPDFSAQLDALDKNKTYLIHCWAGGRSDLTHDLMFTHGFHEVYDMQGGIEAFRVLPGAGAYLVP